MKAFFDFGFVILNACSPALVVRALSVTANPDAGQATSALVISQGRGVSIFTIQIL